MPWEARWFDEDMQRYAKAVKWFDLIGGDSSIEKRIDHYIFLPKSVEVGMKIRGGTKEMESPPRMELKWRRRCHAFHLFERKVVGVGEEWVKWSWTAGEINSNDPSVTFLPKVPDGPILEFEKERRMRRYRFDREDGSITPAKIIPADENGVISEVTRISFGKHKWWSLGIEVFGPRINFAQFKNASEQILADWPIKLQKTQSFGYPQWIKLNIGRQVQKGSR